jgi:hypothetical protein
MSMVLIIYVSLGIKKAVMGNRVVDYKRQISQLRQKKKEHLIPYCINFIPINVTILSKDKH